MNLTHSGSLLENLLMLKALPTNWQQVTPSPDQKSTLTPAQKLIQRRKPQAPTDLNFDVRRLVATTRDEKSPPRVANEIAEVVKLIPVDKMASQSIDMSSEDATTPGLNSTVRNTPRQWNQTDRSWRRFTRKRRTDYLPSAKFKPASDEESDVTPVIPSVAVTQRMPRNDERFSTVQP